MQGSNTIGSAATLLLVIMLVNCSLYQLAQAAAGAAAATTGEAAATTTTNSSTSTSTNGASSGGAATTSVSSANSGPLSQMQGLVGGALNFASMPLNTISASLNQMGLPSIATAPINAVTNLFHQAGSVYGR